MKLIIFGAGASYDSYYEPFLNIKSKRGWRPPLGNELFDRRTNFREILRGFPGADSLSSVVNTLNDIENFFEEKWQFVNSNYSIELLAKLINTQYYLQKLLYEVSRCYNGIGYSNYEVLLHLAYEYSKARKEDVIAVSFNYDILLEQSLCKVLNIPKLTSIDEYVKFPIKIIKPHGSCDWFSKLNINTEEKSTNNYLYENSISLSKILRNLEDEYVLVDNMSLINSTSSVKYFPRLLLPYKTKDEFILPSDHLSYFESKLHQITEILIVGWKCQEESFLELVKREIGDNKVNITLVVLEEDELISNILKQYIPNSEITFFTHPYELQRKNSTSSLFATIAESKEIVHTNGSFSSYILNVMNKKFENFFAY